MADGLGINLYKSEVCVSENGRLEVNGAPFAPGERVEVIVLPASFAKSAARMLELMLRSVDLNSFHWRDVTVSAVGNRFEDMAFLFESSVLNRGLVRLDFDEASAVFKAVSSLADPKGVEIGRFKGGSTFLLAVAIGDAGKLLSIDIAPKDDDALLEALIRAGVRERVELVRADANTVPPDADYAFVFIDGDHSYEAARRDHNRWGKQVKTGGVVIHHDMSHSRRYSTQLAPLAQLRADILNQQKDVLPLAQEAGSVAIFRRTDAPWIDVEAVSSPGH